MIKINWRNPNNHNRSALMICSFRGQNRTAKWLVKEKKARVNGVDDLGCTALNLAARGGCPKVIIKSPISKPKYSSISIQKLIKKNIILSKMKIYLSLI